MEKNMDFPQHFRCPISMELMKDPVTISTGVTYERKNIEKWFNTYGKKTCPATMQIIENFDVTPNHTLIRLITSWCNSRNDQNPCPDSDKYEELMTILSTIETTPFKATYLRKLRFIIEEGDGIMEDFKKSGGVEVLVKIIVQILVENLDFVSFRACEEALGVLQQVPFTEEDETILMILTKTECMKAMAIMLQRGGEEARFGVISTFQKLGRAGYQWNYVVQEQGIEFFKSLLEILSDENCRKASPCALQVLVQVLEASKKSRLKAIEAGAVCTLIELLPDSNRPKCEKIMHLLKLMCKCAEGRYSFTEHGMGIATVSKKMLNVSNCVNEIGVKILWLVSSMHANERVLEEMLLYGAVKKLVAMLQLGTGGGGGGGGGGGTIREKVVRMLKMHGRTWWRYPCLQGDLRSYLGSLAINDSS